MHPRVSTCIHRLYLYLYIHIHIQANQWVCMQRTVKLKFKLWDSVCTPCTVIPAHTPTQARFCISHTLRQGEREKERESSLPGLCTVQRHGGGASGSTENQYAHCAFTNMYITFPTFQSPLLFSRCSWQLNSLSLFFVTLRILLVVYIS